MSCELCRQPAGERLAETDSLWVILVDEPGYPGFCRVVWKAHVKEMSDLSAAQRHELMDWVHLAEAALRQVMNPDKVNLASLGNVVPHLHWHVIPRFADDPHFPSPIWAAARRDGADHGRAGLGDALRQALQARLARHGQPRWLDYKVEVHTVPAGLAGDDASCYRFFVDSGLLWPVDHIDEHGAVWLALQRGAHGVETLRLETGSYRRVPCDTPYPIHC